MRFSLSDLKSKDERELFGWLVDGESLFVPREGKPFAALPMPRISELDPAHRVSTRAAERFISIGAVVKARTLLNGYLTEYKIANSN